MEHEIILQMSRLLERTGMENVITVIPGVPAGNEKALETTLINLKNINARYEKGEAINQIQWLMNEYNIQIDELMERISS
jgi:hypothetical protein